MFIIPREPDVRRRSKVYSNSKAARSSRISLLSAVTTNTSSSGGSGSTITQESYNRSHRTRRRRTKEHRGRRHYVEDTNRSVDVFDFLVEEKSNPRESLHLVGDTSDNCQPFAQAAKPKVVVVVEHDSEYCSDGGHDDEAAQDASDKDDESDDDEPVMVSASTELDVVGKEEKQPLRPSIEEEDTVDSDPDPEVYYRSMSDSGISMGSSGSCQLPLPILYEESDSRPNSRAKHGNELALIDPRWHWPGSSPQPPHDGYIPPPCPQPPPAVVYDVPLYPYPYPHPPYTPYSTPPPPMPEPYYREALAIREPKGQRIKPGYFRSFSKISNRLLVRMQDDLADLEEELKQVEEELDDAERDSDNSTSSSRSIARELRLREDEIHQELHAQLDQYYHALEMMQKVDDMSQPAKMSDLPKHRQWLESRVLQPERIRRLISNDLRKFSTNKQSPENPVLQEQNFQPQYLAYTAFINGVLPLAMFKAFTGVLNRLILLLTIVIIGTTVQGRISTTVGKNELTCTLVCICISAFAAIFL